MEVFIDGVRALAASAISTDGVVVHGGTDVASEVVISWCSACAIDPSGAAASLASEIAPLETVAMSFGFAYAMGAMESAHKPMATVVSRLVGHRSRRETGCD